MNLEEYVRKYIDEGYELNDARSKVAQDVVLTKICKSNFKNHITVKGGVVMHSISNSIRRATRDLDLDFIKYSLEDDSICEFIKKLNSVNDNINIQIVGNITELSHQDYNGKRVNIKLIDEFNYTIDAKLDIGVHKLFELEQDDYYFNLDALGEGISLLINSPEQIFTEKLKSLLKLGFRSTRYKDLFDFYYLIDNNKLDENKLLKTFKIIIFDDETMREETIGNIISRLESIFNSKIYRSNLSNPKVNWLDISIDDAITKVLDYIYELEKETIAV
ncbi:MAG TPA: nucleotidyl transferase AbiEii/AbiGii toxin family protein [Candidatus Faecisoma merdavium]|nr:nucleotidyl transferase AbiEii/AbiGii toxin family protein [Candidatus Faecisoma merdavium]